jgi:hypothetical protein
MLTNASMRRSDFRLVVLLTVTAGLAGFGLRAQSQTPSVAAGTGLLMGVVTDGLSDTPVPGAVVTLGDNAVSAPTRGGPGEPIANKVMTNGQGRFVFTELAKGSYTLTASKRGYMDGMTGRRRVNGPGQSVLVADGERVIDLRIPIWKNGAIMGTITDDIGEPMVRVPVRALQRTFVAGKRRLVAAGALAKTDDRGVYRLGALPPGEYIVVVPSTQITAPESVVSAFQASRLTNLELYGEFEASGSLAALNALSSDAPFRIGDLAFTSYALERLSSSRAGVTPGPSANGRMFVFPTQYYPASLVTSQATPIILASGEERSGIDVQLKLVPTSRVSGVVRGPDGPVGITLSLSPIGEDGSAGVTIDAAISTSDAAGRFTFLGVPAGQYQLRAFRTPPAASRSGGAGPSPDSSTLWTMQTVIVESTDIPDLAVTLRPGFRITGRAGFERATNAALPQTLRAGTVEPADGRPLASTSLARGAFDETFAFSTSQLPSGRYLLRFSSPPPNFALKGAMLDGRDISRTPVALDRDRSGLIVTFTDKPAELYGQVQNAAGAADPSATVLIVPGDSMPTAASGDPPAPLHAVRVERDGSYRISGLGAGSYLVVAVPDEATSDWQDPRVLASLARFATSVKLTEGERRSVSLRSTMVSR